MRDKKLNIVPILILFYVVICIYILVTFMFHELAWKDGEIYTSYFLKMSAVSFPIGIIVSILVDFIFSFIGVGQKITALTLWALMTIAGALQWFVLIPECYKYIKKSLLTVGSNRDK